MDPCGHRHARHRHRRRVRRVRSRVPVSRPATAPSPRSDVAWGAATCFVLPVGGPPGAASARDRAGAARDRDPGRHRDGERGARDVVGSALDTLASRLGIGPDRQVTVVAEPVSEDAAGPLREQSQSGVPERSNPGAAQRTHAQSQPAQTDPPFDDPTTTDQAGVAPTGGPSMLTATPTSASTIELAWSNTAGESAYRLERSTNGGAAGWAPVTTSDRTSRGSRTRPC